MIDAELLDILEDATDKERSLNRLTDEFRDGRDANELMILLNSSNAELVSFGAWILGELRFELYNSQHFVSRLHELTDHEDPHVRFHALGALYPALARDDVVTQRLLARLCADANEGVRMRAEAAAKRLSLR